MAGGNVIFGKLPDTKRQAEFRCDGPILNPDIRFGVQRPGGL